jgi:hypothetical protein
VNYPRLYRHKTVDQVSKKVTLKYGWPTNKTTKPLMIDGLSAAVREHDLTVYDKRTIAELKTYVRDELAKMHGSPHDDTVMALAIAWQMIDYALGDYEVQDPGPGRWTGQWWIEQAVDSESAGPGRVSLGKFNRRASCRGTYSPGG